MQTKTFIMKGRCDAPDVPFQLNDLLPLPQSKSYSLAELTQLIDYNKYYADMNWTMADFKVLYRKPENKGADFFTIRDTGIVVIPGAYIYPILLKENQTL